VCFIVYYPIFQNKNIDIDVHTLYAQGHYIRRREELLSDFSWGLDDTVENEPDTGTPFTIALMNMGTDTSYDHLFKKAARRWEQIVIGDLPDVEKRTNPTHDWFGDQWPNADPVNVGIDDILIGYSMETVDGLNGVLGFAGPVYSRESNDSISAVSGIMKFDKEDFDE
jgi:hypothetical protein